MKQVTILFFATLKEKIGSSKIELQLEDNAAVADLKRTLQEKFPKATQVLAHSLVSINQNFAFDQDVLPPGCEVGIFPPVSGGSFPTIFLVTEDPLEIDSLIRQITLPSTGAVCSFIGTVREITQRDPGTRTVRLEYEAYVPMAESKMAQVADEIRERWPAVEGIVIVQRIGNLDPGTPTVLIACSASHRDTGVFDATKYGIDRLKEIVPIWKKEIKPESEEWIEGKFIPTRKD